MEFAFNSGDSQRLGKFPNSISCVRVFFEMCSQNDMPRPRLEVMDSHFKGAIAVLFAYDSSARLVDLSKSPPQKACLGVKSYIVSDQDSDPRLCGKIHK